MGAHRTLTGGSQAKQQIPSPNVCDHLLQPRQSTQRLYQSDSGASGIQKRFDCLSWLSWLAITDTGAFAATICHAPSWP